MDEVDGKLLELLQADARTPNVELARQVGMAPSAVLERVRKLEERGLIESYEAKLNPQALGLGLLAFILVRTDDADADALNERFTSLPEVQEVHNVAGEDCYLLKIRVADTHAMAKLLREKIASIPAVRSTRSTIVLETFKESSKLPVRRGS